MTSDHFQSWLAANICRGEPHDYSPHAFHVHVGDVVLTCEQANYLSGYLSSMATDVVESMRLRERLRQAEGEAELLRLRVQGLEVELRRARVTATSTGGAVGFEREVQGRIG